MNSSTANSRRRIARPGERWGAWRRCWARRRGAAQNGGRCGRARRPHRGTVDAALTIVLYFMCAMLSNRGAPNTMNNQNTPEIHSEVDRAVKEFGKSAQVFAETAADLFCSIIESFRSAFEFVVQLLRRGACRQ